MMATAMLMQQSPASQGHLTAIPDPAFLAATGTYPIIAIACLAHGYSYHHIRRVTVGATTTVLCSFTLTTTSP